MKRQIDDNELIRKHKKIIDRLSRSVSFSETALKGHAPLSRERAEYIDNLASRAFSDYSI